MILFGIKTARHPLTKGCRALALEYILKHHSNLHLPLTGFWIKFHTSILENVDIAMLPDNLWRRLAELKLILGHDHPSGDLPSVREIAFRLRIDDSVILREMEELLERGLIARQDDRYNLPNFREEQGADSIAERVARHRGKKRHEAPCNDDETIRYTERKKERLEQKDQNTESAPPSGDAGECDDDFDKFWEAFPKKVDRLKALEAWVESSRKRPHLNVILSAIEAGKREWKGKDDRYIPTPANWLANERWSDRGVMIEKPTARPTSTKRGPIKVDAEKFKAWMIEVKELPEDKANTHYKDCPPNIQNEYWNYILAPAI